MSRRLLTPERNCWRVGRADAAAVLIDAESYFESLYVNLQKARRSIYILAWDVDSRQRLIMREPGPDEPPAQLGAFLDHLVRHNDELEIHLLCWDYSPIFALGREPFQTVKLGWRTHPRFHFRFDQELAFTASHHHKIVVVDDALAYSGGLDITGARWDTMNHVPDDERRVLPNGEPFAPFHDVQIALTGQPARWLGELCRERWLRGTGEALAAPECRGALGSGFELPEQRFEGPRVGLSRTVPYYKNVREVREVERLFLDLIDAARRYVYIENQYFTCNVVTEHLVASLSRPRGPEIVIVLPKVQDNWLSSLTMGNLAGVALDRLRKADRHRRLRVVYPEDVRLEHGWYTNVHAKVMAVDDEYLRVGSANLNNRSMGLDTECDVVVAADGDDRVKRQIHATVARLIGHHAGLGAAETGKLWQQAGGRLVPLVELLARREPKALKPMPRAERGWLEDAVAELEVIDPEQPLGVDRLIDEVMFQGKVRAPWHALGICFAFALLGSAVGPVTVGMPFFLAVFFVAGVFGVPLAVPVAAAALFFPFRDAVLVSLAGATAVAIATYGFGKVASSRLVHRSSYYLMRQPTVRRRVWAMALVRFFPVAPYALASVAAGHAGVGFWPYLAGSLVHGVPALLLIVGLQKLLVRATLSPTFWSLGEAALAVGVTAWLLFLTARRALPLGERWHERHVQNSDV